MESESEKTVKTCAIQAERTRAEKAEAERDEFKQIHRHALDSVDQVPDASPSSAVSRAVPVHREGKAMKIEKDEEPKGKIR